MTAAAPVRSRISTAPRVRHDVAGSDHRNVDELDELGSQPVVGLARVHLAGRARVKREALRAGVDEPRPELETGPRTVLETAAHLHRHGNGDGFRHGGDDPAGAVGLVEQRRAGPGLRHLADGAAEVHVDDVGACGDDGRRGLGHVRRLGAEDLDGQRPLVFRDSQIAERALVAVVNAGATHHLGADETGAVAPALPPERLHAHARHRREHEPRRDLHGADAPRVTKIYLHRARILCRKTGLHEAGSNGYNACPRLVEAATFFHPQRLLTLEQ